jgi:hypothetical protein
MTSQVLALVTAGAAVALGLWNASRVRSLERFKSELAREDAAIRAKVDYEYDARRRLYARFDPALFQLLDLAEYALEQISSLTETARWQEFVPAENEPGRAVGRPTLVKPNYAAVSTVYGLYAPMVIIRSISRQLTLVDLSLDRRMELQYFLAARLYGTFKDDNKLAALDPAVPYEPFHPDWRRLRLENPSKHWWQGLTMGRLEGVLDLLTVTSSDDSQRLASFGEFEQRWDTCLQADDERGRKHLAAASNALLGFRPDHRAVYWRVLIAQARLYQALLRTKADGFAVPDSTEAWTRLLALSHSERFEWKSDLPGARALAETLSVTDRYFSAMLEDSQLTTRPPPGDGRRALTISITRRGS